MLLAIEKRGILVGGSQLNICGRKTDTYILV